MTANLDGSQAQIGSVQKNLARLVPQAGTADLSGEVAIGFVQVQALLALTYAVQELHVTIANRAATL